MGFMEGYFETSPSNARLRIVVGVNNKRFANPNGLVDMTTHGSQWANLIDSLNLYANSGSPPLLSSKLWVVGGMDIEMSYSRPGPARRWADSFSAYQTTRILNYYDFGECPGCQNPAVPLPNRWTQDDVYHVAWEADAAFPLPLIYNTAGENANQWENLNLYEIGQGRSRMSFKGAVTQYAACQQVGGCTGTDNTPAAGWTQLYNALHSNPATTQGLKYSTDMKWQYP